MNNKERYCAESHGAMKRLRRDPGTGLHENAVRGDQPNPNLCGQRNKRENSCIVKQEMVGARDDRAAGRRRRGRSRDDHRAYDDGVEDPQPSV
ncbi:MAG: hypothetical protein ACRDND_30105 [Streptosporangiaceae bacterium]